MRRPRTTPPRLNRRLRLEEVTRVADGAGGFTEAWVEKGWLWAEVRSLSGRETTQGRAPLSVQRLRDGARIFRITAVGEADAEGRFLTLQVQEEAVT